MKWTATATRFDRIDGTEDHTEVLVTDTTFFDASTQAQLDANMQEDEPTPLRWQDGPDPDGAQIARTAHNEYRLIPSA